MLPMSYASLMPVRAWLRHCRGFYTPGISGCQRLDVPGLPLDVPGLPLDVPGLPLDVPGLPLDVPGLPLDVPGLPLDVPGLPLFPGKHTSTA